MHITMIKILIFLIYLKLGMCHWSEVRFNFTEIDREKFPWMVVITKYTNLIAYGSLISDKAVLTLAHIEIDHDYFYFQVFADCYITGVEALIDDSDYRCPMVRDVKEYIIIEDNNINNNNNYYHNNLAILTLTQPFKLSTKLNIINVNTAQPKFNPNLCVIFSLRTLLNLNTNEKARHFCSTLFSVNENNKSYTVKQLHLGDGNMSTFNFRQQIESFDHFSKMEFKENFSGSPVVCKLVTDVNSEWVIIGVSNLSIINYPNAGKLKLTGEIIPIDYGHKEIFEEIMKITYIS